MCTIGTILPPAGGTSLTFKQCDLTTQVSFLEPEIRTGSGGTRYVAFEREGAGGPWAGFNEHGVCLMGADAYLDEDSNPEVEPEGDVMEAYEDTLAHCETAKEAALYMPAAYASLGVPDIVLVGDRRRAFLVEHSPSLGSHRREKRRGPLVSTNHFQRLPGAVTQDVNPSTYVRLRRARSLLNRSPDLDGVLAVLRDQAHGESELSICRVAQEDGEYFTQASLVVAVQEDGQVDCLYLLEGNPRTRAFVRWTDVFGESVRTEEEA